jgi:hypothetical protein
MSGSQPQGAAFEENFRDLLGVLIEALGLELIENRIQTPGPQYGKDIQTRWRDAGGHEVFWQFECKSHKTGSLPGKEVADKLFDLMRSSHAIDVWALTLAEIEPGQWIDETFAWARTQLALSFEIEVVSPGARNIKRLFAYEPQLFQRQYPDERPPHLDDRESVLRQFGEFLAEATARARSRRESSLSPWQLVVPDLMMADDDPDRASAYLRGLAATGPWDAVANGWAVWRTSSVSPLVERILTTDPGFDFAWLVAAGGEGKTTAMRQVAWTIASDHDDWTVLWTEAELRGETAEIPVALIEEVSDNANILLCIDGSEGLAGAAKLHAAADRLARSGKRVFALFADRGIVWNRSRLPGRLRRGLPHVERRVDLERLTTDEARGVVEALRRRSLLTRFSPEEAVERLVAEHDGPWLLPTLMQLTDPEGRGFEGILASVLSGVRDDDRAGPLRLLLAAAIVQASGHPLPEDLAERLVDGCGGFTASMEALTGELASQFGIAASAVGFGRPSRIVVTHHRLVSEGFVSVAANSTDFSQRFLDAAEALPQTITQEVTVDELIPKPRFRLLDASLRYILTLDPPLFEAADRFLRSLISLDPRQFPALSRLGDCDTEWLRAEMRKEDCNATLVDALAESARTAYKEALRVGAEVLAPGNERPAPYAGYDLADNERIVRHEWGVLEDTAAQRTGDVPGFKRAVMLFLQDGSDRALSTLPLPLLHLGEMDRAARAAAGYRALAVTPTDRAVVRSQEKMLRDVGEVVPNAGVEVLPELWADLVTNLLLDDWAEIGLYATREEHVDALRGILRQGAAGSKTETTSTKQ